jgi:flagellar hook-basal body complex protein FliE
MVERIGQGGNLARDAIEAALKRQAEVASKMRQVAGAAGNLAPTAGGQAGVDPSGANKVSSFSTALGDGLASLNSQVQDVDHLPMGLLSGKVTNFHEVAARLKESELSMRFSLEVRNKFIDVYREIMRMSV